MPKFIRLPDNATREEIIYGVQVWSTPDERWLLLHDVELQVEESDTAMTNRLILNQEDQGVLTGNIEINVSLEGTPQPTPEPEPEPTTTAIAEVRYEMNVRSQTIVSKETIVGSLAQGSHIEVELDVITANGYEWRTIAVGNYAGRFVAQKNLDTRQEYLRILSEPAPAPVPQPEPSPTPGSNILTIQNSRLAYKGQIKRIGGATLARRAAFPGQPLVNPYTANITPQDWFGNPQIETNGIFGKMKATFGPSLIRVFASYSTLTIPQMVDHVGVVLDYAQKHDHMICLCLTDSHWQPDDDIKKAQAMAILKGDIPYHTGPLGHLNIRYVIEKAYERTLGVYLDALLAKFGNHPNLVMINPINEFQIGPEDRKTYGIKALNATVGLLAYVGNKMWAVNSELLLYPGWPTARHWWDDTNLLLDKVSALGNVVYNAHLYQPKQDWITDDTWRPWVFEDDVVKEAPYAIQKGMPPILGEFSPTVFGGGQRVGNYYQVEATKALFGRLEKLGFAGYLSWVFDYPPADYKDTYNGTGAMSVTLNPDYFGWYNQWWFDNYK